MMRTYLPHDCVRGCSVDIVYADILRKDSNKDVRINRNIYMLVKLLKFSS